MIMPSTAATNAARAFGKCAVMLPYHGFTVEKLDFGFPSGAGFCRDTSVCMVRYQDRLVAWRRVSCESAPLSRESVPFGGCIAFDSGVRHGLKLKKGSRLAPHLMPTLLVPGAMAMHPNVFYVQPDAWPMTTKSTYLSDGSKELGKHLRGFMEYFGFKFRTYFVADRFWTFLDTDTEAWPLMPGMPFGFLVPEK